MIDGRSEQQVLDAPGVVTPVPQPSTAGVGVDDRRRKLLLVSAAACVCALAIGTGTALLGLRQAQQDIALLKAAVVANQQRAQAPAKRPPEPLPTEPVSIEGAALKGSPTANVVIVEFSDFQCPFCSRFTLTTLPDLDREYIRSGKVLLAFRHMPIDEIHPNARRAAESAECAGRQGKFWEMHDRLFADPRRLGPEDIQSYAKAIGLGRSPFDGCMNGGATDRIALDLAEAQRLNVYGTPGFLIGTIEADRRVRVTDRLSGAQPMPAFRVVLDRLLSRTE